MIFIAKLILAHLIGDFLLQPLSWVKHKAANKLKSWALYVHVIIHGLLVFALTQNIIVSVSILIVHFIIDAMKLYAQNEDNQHQWFVRDQLLHLLSIAGIAILLNGESQIFIDWLTADKTLILITAIYFLTQPVSIIMANVLRPWSDEISEEEEISLAKAGRFIGTLERLFVFAFILSGHWEAVGFLLAAKSVFRFGDLRESKERKLTEYILIGTLLSFGLAILTGVVIQYLI